MNYDSQRLLTLGNGGSRVLCLHGLGSCAKVFQDCIPQNLLSKYTFICPNLPGHGLQHEVMAQYSIESMCTWLESQIQTHTPHWFMGHSLGALIALLTHWKKPCFKKGLILDLFPSARHPRALRKLAIHFQLHHEAALRHFYGFSHHDREGLLSRILADAKECDPRVFSEIFASLANLAESITEPILQNIPLTVIHQPGHSIDSEDRVNRILLNTSDLSMIPMTASGHFVMLTDLPAFQRILTDCLLSSRFLL